MPSPIQLLMPPAFKRALKNGLDPSFVARWSRHWFDAQQVKDALDALDNTYGGSLTGQEKRVAQMLRRLLVEHEAPKPISTPPASALLRELAVSHPNFTSVVEHVLAQQALMRTRHAMPRRLQPMLLLGSPGIGKTSFVQALSAAMCVSHRVVSINTSSAGFCLSGLDRGWATGKEGLVFTLLMQSATLNPLVMLDEVDKSGSNEKSDPLGPLYQLLEMHTARQFRDEFLGIEVNASFITWVASANTCDSLPLPLLDRFKVFDIAAPDSAQMETIVRNQYAALRKEAPALAEALSSDVVDCLRRKSPRESQAALQSAAGMAAMRTEGSRSGTVTLKVGDLPAGMPASRSMGFV